MAENQNRRTDPTGVIRTAMLGVMSADDYAHVRLALLKANWSALDQARHAYDCGLPEVAAEYNARAAHFGDLYERMT
jgi:hypothetical protein